MKYIKTAFGLGLRRQGKCRPGSPGKGRAGSSRQNKGRTGSPRSARPLRSLGLALACVVTTNSHAASDITSLSLEQLLEVHIVGASKYEQKQSEVAAAVSIITRQEVKAFGWRTLAKALASLPGVHTTYDRQYTYLGMRGFGLPGDLTARVLIAINGNRVNDPVYDGGAAGRELALDLDLVERIEFIPGPGGELEAMARAGRIDAARAAFERVGSEHARAVVQLRELMGEIA